LHPTLHFWHVFITGPVYGAGVVLAFVALVELEVELDVGIEAFVR